MRCAANRAFFGGRFNVLAGASAIMASENDGHVLSMEVDLFELLNSMKCRFYVFSIDVCSLAVVQPMVDLPTTVEQD